MLPILAIIAVVDAVAMGYSYYTCGELYGLDYYLLGHDYVGEGIDYVFDRLSDTSESVFGSGATDGDWYDYFESIWASFNEQLMIIMILVVVAIVLILVFGLIDLKSHRKKGRDHR